ncbi:MmcQ/YjbR family DNA-binding protein [Altibacter sp. HG106]|uniref:MmcQ/YjbR family DNA-binding protein n=1 Tax=Altibacter sp. HG106 TaxID=3023937 RepID=UPI002350B968|nr:MmcQ/YjbR family DNA-binding protein [Altibacter sp. HG106]MDC7994077.1 MmcQ/YjbR family DNA-binding protein [Altibacter sp. HG106]
MNIEQFRDYCLQKKGVTESFPFDNDTLVFKVMNKMFALASLERQPLTANLKCDPERSLELREAYDGLIIPGYHMNKKHWNTVTLEGAIPAELLYELIDHSYQLIVDGLPKKVREAHAKL